MTPVVRIVGSGLHWLVPDPQHDLCAHGAFALRVGGECFGAGEADDLALSTGALHLLRSVASDHTPESPLAEHLVPCCGHFMVVDDASGRVENLGCPEGVDWWVRHVGGEVVLTRGDGEERRVARDEWARAVAAFADDVAAFFDASPPREPGDEHAASWFAAMREEWARLRGKIVA
jgi:hypothetical protein